MGANPNLPRREDLEQRERLRVITGGHQRQARRYVVGAVIVIALLVLLLVLAVVRFAGRGPATGPPPGSRPTHTTRALPPRLH